jgi:hypothetical protein
MKIKKQWLVMQNNYLVTLVKTTSNKYFYFEETNKCAFMQIEKQVAKDLIKKTIKNYQ